MPKTDESLYLLRQQPLFHDPVTRLATPLFDALAVTPSNTNILVALQLLLDGHTRWRLWQDFYARQSQLHLYDDVLGTVQGQEKHWESRRVDGYVKTFGLARAVARLVSLADEMYRVPAHLYLQTVEDGSEVFCINIPCLRRGEVAASAFLDGWNAFELRARQVCTHRELELVVLCYTTPFDVD